MITTRGKLQIMRFLARHVTDVARGIAIGVANDTSVESATDRNLDFEFSRSPINLVSADYASVPNKVIFKATIPADVSGQFTDIGLFSSEVLTGLASSMMLTDFSDQWSAGTIVQTNSHIGPDSLKISAGASASQLTDLVVDLDLSDYDRDSRFKLAFHATANVASVEVGLHSGANSSTYSFVPTAGYQVEEFTIGDLTGTADLSAIDLISVETTSTAGGTGEVTLDGLRIDAFDPLDEENILVARKILDTPLIKQAGLPMDIEYNLEVTL